MTIKITNAYSNVRICKENVLKLEAYSGGGAGPMLTLPQTFLGKVPLRFRIKRRGEKREKLREWRGKRGGN